MRLDAVGRMSRQDDAEGKSLQVKHEKTSRSLLGFLLCFFSCEKRHDSLGLSRKTFFFRSGTERSRRGHLLHGLEESLAVVLEGHDELQLSSSRLHRCRGKADNNNKKKKSVRQRQIGREKPTSGKQLERPAPEACARITGREQNLKS